MTNKHMNGSAAHGAASEAARPKRRRRTAGSSAAQHEVMPKIPEWWGVPRSQIVKWGMGMIAALVAAGWITVAIPAKQADVDSIRGEITKGFARIDQGFASISTKFQSLEGAIQSLREDVVRVQAIQDFSAPAAPPRPARRVTKPAPPKPELKANSIFGW